MTRLGIVTGLVKEAAIVRRATAAAGASAPIVQCTGPGPDRAARAARAALAEGAEALLSFGVAGGLDPDLRRGTVVVADRVIAPDGSALDCDAAWQKRVLASRLPKVTMVSAALAGSVKPVPTAERKADLFEKTHPAAVDMESFIVARIADREGLPFLCLRAIADPASREVPEAWMRAVGADGRIIPLAVFFALIELWFAAELVMVALDGRAAFAALRRVARLGPGFGLV